MTSGWLFDAYPLDNKMIFWIKQENGNTVRLEDNNWSPSVYVVSDNYTDLLKSLQEEKLIKTYDFALRFIITHSDNHHSEDFDYILATKDITIPLLTINEPI